MRRATYIAFSAFLFAIACLGQGPGHLSTISTNEFIDEKQFTENQYFESFILKDIALMLFYSKAGTATKVQITANGGPSNQSEYRVALDNTNVAINLSKTLPAWEPARYAAAVDRLAAALTVQKPVQSAPRARAILGELSNPSIETISTISVDLSQKLKRNMLDPSLHERAGLLLAAFALRERLEPFDDPRWALSRLTAHLALGRWASGKEPGSDGAYALVAAYALMNLQTNALGRLHRLEADPQTSIPWNRALYARITADPRRLTALKAEDLTRLEWAERIYAVSRSISKGSAAKELGEFARANGENAVDSDLFFCVFRGWAPGSVGLGGSLYMPTGLKLTIRDAALAWQSSQGSVLKVKDSQELATRFNVQPGLYVHSEGQVDVIDWGAWAMQSQRRLATIYLRRLEFMRDYWGWPKDEVDKEQAAMDQSLGGLCLVRCYRIDLGPGYGFQFIEPFKDFAANRPAVPMSLARYIVEGWNTGIHAGPHKSPPSGGDLAAARWTACLYPCQTFVSLEGTMRYLEKSLDLPFVLQQAPYNFHLIQKYIKTPGLDATQIESALRPVADYDSEAARMLADRLPPDQIKAKEAVYQKLAAQDPHYYVELADLFAKTNLPKAALFFDRARASGADRVTLSHRAEKFVRYYFSTGNKEKAQELAREAEDVASAAGYQAMMTYCILSHDFERGLKSAQADEEHYDDHYVVALYMDQVRKEQPSYHGLDNVYKMKMTELFPNGINAYQNYPAAPLHGVAIQSNSRSLRVGDIVVALNGKSVESTGQLRYLRKTYTLETGEDENIPMLVFREGRYLEVKDTTANTQVADYSLTGPPRLRNFSTSSSVRATATSPARIKGLRLTGISGTSTNRLAMINGKTMAAGESTSIKLFGEMRTVRCLSINDNSVAVEVAGVIGPRVLSLNDPAAD